MVPFPTVSPLILVLGSPRPVSGLLASTTPASPVSSGWWPMTREPPQEVLWGPALAFLYLLCLRDLLGLTIAPTSTVPGIYKLPSYKAGPLQALHPAWALDTSHSPPNSPADRASSCKSCYFPVWQPNQRYIRACSALLCRDARGVGCDCGLPTPRPPYLLEASDQPSMSLVFSVALVPCAARRAFRNVW